MEQPRESIMAGLLNVFSTGLNITFKSTGRKYIPSNQVALADRPVLLVLKRRELYKLEFVGAPVETTLQVFVIIYVNTADVVPAESVTNPVLDAFDTLLKPPPLMQTQTLNGLVNNIWQEGEAITIPGDNDGDGIIVVPLKVLVP